MSRDERSSTNGTIVAATAAALTVAIGLTVSSLIGPPDAPEPDAPEPAAAETAAAPDVVLVPVERAAEPAPAWDDEDDDDEEARHGEREHDDDDEEHEEHERRGRHEDEDDD